MLNGIVGYQLIDDGTPTSLALILTSTAALFIGTGYIALDHAFLWTDFWEDSLTDPNLSYALYTLYQLLPLVFIVVFFVLESILVLRILGERRPMSKFLFNLARGLRDYVAHLMKNKLLLTCGFSFCSLPYLSSPSLRTRSNLPICHKRTHLQRHRRRHKRRFLRDAANPLLRRVDLCLLVQHYRR